MDGLSEWLDRLLGLSQDPVGLGQVAARCVLLYVAALAMVRAADKRFLGKHTAFDVILAVILGSVVSRALTENVTVLGHLAAGFVLVGLHLVMSNLAYRSDWFGTLVKGRPRTLIHEGEIDWSAMAKSSITRDDLIGLMRHEASTGDPEEIESAHLERSGDVSFIKRSPEPMVVDVRVEDGVQIVRLRRE